MISALLAAVAISTLAPSPDHPVSAQACADVDFLPVSRRRFGFVVHERVKATVRFPDGHEESAEYPYPWIYNEPLVSDPWLSPNDLPILQPTPPPDVPRAALPPLITFLLAHADAAGRLTLRPCTAKPRTVTLLERLDKGRLQTAVSVDRDSGIEAAIRFARAYSNPVMVCAMVQNAGAKPIRRTAFLVTYRDAAGKQLGVETLNIDISIAPGGLVGTPPPSAPSSLSDGCRVIGEGWPPTRRDQIADVRLTLRSAEYADGTRWPIRR
jgi:hypothetical protein